MKIILDKIKHFVQTNSIKSRTLSSLIFDFDTIDFSSILNNIQKIEEPFFYTTHVKKNISFLGFNSVFQVKAYGDSRIENTEKKISELEENFCSNWSEYNVDAVPLFLGGMKFSIDNSNELWSDFSDSDWFIPKFLFLELDGRSFVVYNFFGNPFVNDKITSDFDTLKILLTKNNSDRTIGKIKISSNGKEKKSWIDNVNKALREIDSGSVQKIVLSRQVNLELESKTNITKILEKLGENYPRCYVFAFRKNKSIFFGASPEKLAKISNGIIEADALAGSISRGKTEEEDTALAETLLASKKDLAEQKIVVSFIKNSFTHFCDNVIYEKHPIIRKLPNIQHLWTPIKGEVSSEQSIFSILKELHPTPAICGVPWTKARDSIIEMEPHDRGLFSGMIGWFNFNNEGEFAVAIRSALLKEKTIYAFAGCGIVNGSVPEIEYAESELKLRPIISLFENIK